MITATCEFKHGYAKPLNRGVVLWNGSRDDISPDNPRRWFGDLVYELIGADSVWSSGYNLKGIKLTIEIDEATEQ